MAHLGVAADDGLMTTQRGHLIGKNQQLMFGYDTHTKSPAMQPNAALPSPGLNPPRHCGTPGFFGEVLTQASSNVM